MQGGTLFPNDVHLFKVDEKQWKSIQVENSPDGRMTSSCCNFDDNLFLYGGVEHNGKRLKKGNTMWILEGTGTVTKRHERIGEWIVDRELGKGAEAIVKLVHHESDQVKFLALRLLRMKNLEKLQNSLSEVDILLSLQHVNIINIIKTFSYTSDSDLLHLGILMPYCDLGDLKHYLFYQRNMGEMERLNLLIQILMGVTYLVRKWSLIPIAFKENPPSGFKTRKHSSCFREFHTNYQNL